MSAETVDKYLGYADGALGLVPDLPGKADDIAVAAARAAIAAIRALLKRGRTPAQIMLALEAMQEDGAARFDVDAVVSDWLAKNMTEAERTAVMVGNINADLLDGGGDL